MEIKSEEIEIPEDESGFDNIYPINPIATMIVNTFAETPHVLDRDEPKLYTLLKTVEFDKIIEISERLSPAPLIEALSFSTPNDKTKNEYIISKNDSLSPRKSGVKTSGKHSCKRSLSLEESQTQDVNQNSTMMNSVIETMDNMEIKQHKRSKTPDGNKSKRDCDGHESNESVEDIFAESQKSNDCIQPPDDKNIKNNFQQLTPSKIINNLKNSSIDDKLFLSPRSTGQRSNSDSEFERICNSINNKYESGLFRFETMDLLNDSDVFNNSASNKILSNMLEFSNIDDENMNECLTDPLASCSIKNDTENLDDKSLVNAEVNEKKLWDEFFLRRSSRLAAKIYKDSSDEYECKSPPRDVKLERIRRKVKRINKKEAVPLDMMKKVRELKIKLEHKPLPQHELECYISRPPSTRTKKLFVEHGPLKRGIFSSSEDETILRNWKRFCDIHDWDLENYKPFLLTTHRGEIIISTEKRIKFVQFLADDLPWRSLHSVFERFQSLHKDKKKRDKRYTKTEDRKILIYLDNETKYSHKCQELGKLLGRSKDSIWRRYRILKRPNEMKSGIKKTVEWDIPLVENFIKLLLELTMSNEVEELKGQTIPKVVWRKMEKKLGISHETLMHFWLWQLHLQLFYTRPIYENDIKIMLIEYMYVKGIADRREIMWPSITQLFDGLTTHYLSRLFWTLIHNSSLKDKKNLAHVIGWLYEVKIPQLIAKPKDRFLPRLVYKEGKIEIIDDPSKPSPNSSESD